LRPVQELSRYQAVPLHRSPERGELYARFRQGIEERKARLEAVKEREDAALAAVRRQVALLYAGLKWGRNVSLEKGRILFQQA
jgi:hypothetical protein